MSRNVHALLGSLAVALSVLAAPTDSLAQFRTYRSTGPIISYGSQYGYGGSTGYNQPYGMSSGYTYGFNSYGAMPYGYGSGGYGMPGFPGSGGYGYGMPGYTGATANYFYAPSAGTAPRYRADSGAMENAFVGSARMRTDVAAGPIGFGFSGPINKDFSGLSGYVGGCGCLPLYCGWYGAYLPFDGYGPYLPHAGMMASPDRLPLLAERDRAPFAGVAIAPVATSREPVGRTAQIEVRVPKADAELFFEGTKIDSTGTLRRFPSPRLAAGTTYTYEVEARWMDNGKAQNRKMELKFQAGESRTLDFTAGINIKPLDEAPTKNP